MEELKYVIFQLGEYKYGMNLFYVNGIEQSYDVIPVPNAPAGVDGIINLRGEVIPIYSLRQHFNMDSKIDNREKSLLITNSSGTTLAYEVDAVASIEQVTSDQIQKMPSIAENAETAFMDHVLCIGKDIIIEINVNKVLSEELRSSIDKIVEEHSEG